MFDCQEISTDVEYYIQHFTELEVNDFKSKENSSEM